MIAAVQCIRQVFPDSSIKTVRRDNPLRVTIAADVTKAAAHYRSTEGQHNQNDKEQHYRVIWTGKQQLLFGKYPKKRRRTMNIIKSKLSDLHENLLAPNTTMTTTTTKKKEEESKTSSVVVVPPSSSTLLLQTPASARVSTTTDEILPILMEVR